MILVSYIIIWTAGIGPDFQQTIDHGDCTKQDPTSVRELLISAYDKNISTRLKTELFSSDVSSYNNTKETSISKSVSC